MRSVVIAFGLLVLALLLFFRIAELQVWRGDLKLEVVVAATAVLAFFIGAFFNRKTSASEGAGVSNPSVIPAAAGPEKALPAPVGKEEAVRGAGLTARELEVLEQMAAGLSNAEIGAALFLSESTVKTHVSNILFKLDAKRRTAAVQAARARGILS